ncbi:MAG: hypothetical protein ACLP0J_23985 [Solirubrobacteraceae bacterium]
MKFAVTATRSAVAQAARAAQAAQFAQLTGGLKISQVRIAPICAPHPGELQCMAERLVLRSSGEPVHPRVKAQRTFAQVFPNDAKGIARSEASSRGTAPPTTGTPAWLQQAYDLSYLSQTGGVGATIGIVDAYDDPTAESDLATYRSTYGLGPCTSASDCLVIVNQHGQSSPMPVSSSSNPRVEAVIQDWQDEVSLDLDAVSALCPNCHILLVEADSSEPRDLSHGLAVAASWPGVKIVSNSYGDASGTPIGGTWTYPDVATLYASSDDRLDGGLGSGLVDYPAAFPAAIAVGNDVSAGAAWSGIQVYSTSGYTGWGVIGGPSLSSPLVAAFMAITETGSASGSASPNSAYTDAADGILNDPTGGSTAPGRTGTCPILSIGSCPALYICPVGAGYHGPTGAGSISGQGFTGAPGIGGPSFGYGSNSPNRYMQSHTGTTATVEGGVYTNGLDSSDHWQYGTTTSYGHQTPAADAGSGEAPVRTRATLTGLRPLSTYHYRLVAQNADGSTYGYDHTLTTPEADVSDITPPTIIGTAAQTTPLSLSSTGTWNGIPDQFKLQWQRSADGSAWTNIAGATSQRYTLLVGDVGHSVRMLITAQSTHRSSASAASAPIGPVIAFSAWPLASAPSAATSTVLSGAPVNTNAPSIAPSALCGDALRIVSDGVWRPAANRYEVQWQRSSDSGQAWSNISGASSAKYAPVVGDKGDELRANVTAVDSYGKASAASKATSALTASLPVNTARPTVSGTARRASKLNITSAGAWSGGPPLTCTHRWQRSADGSKWTSIAGATGSTYTIGVADENHKLRILVSAKNTDGTLRAASAPTVTVRGAPPVNTAAPTVIGKARRAVTLKATKGSWTGAGNAYAYRWQSSSDGSTWTNIPGATKTSYAIAIADEHNELRVLVTATNPDATVNAASTPSADVQPAPPVNTALPTLSGTAQLPATLVAIGGTWTGSGITYNYQWQRSSDGSTWAIIIGAPSSTYTLQTADEGDVVRAQVSATNPDGTVTASSAASGTIQAAPANTTAPTADAPVTTGS